MNKLYASALEALTGLVKDGQTLALSLIHI